MKKLYRKGTVHPSPPPKADCLSFLPATILTLTVALSAEDREVLAYLISCSSSNFSGNNRGSRGARSSCSSSFSTTIDHPASFECYCFSCYMSYWARWDSSASRQLIHEIIDAYEESGLSVQNKNNKERSRKERRKSNRGRSSSSVVLSDELKRSELSPSNNKEFTESENSVEESSGVVIDDGEEEMEKEEEEEEEEGEGSSSVRRLVSFVGEKIWGVWT